MNKRVLKLKHKLDGDAELAAELVGAGLDTPKKIKRTKNLVKIIGKVKADKVRKKIK